MKEQTRHYVSARSNIEHRATKTRISLGQLWKDWADQEELVSVEYPFSNLDFQQLMIEKGVFQKYCASTDLDISNKLMPHRAE